MTLSKTIRLSGMKISASESSDGYTWKFRYAAIATGWGLVFVYSKFSIGQLRSHHLHLRQCSFSSRCDDLHQKYMTSMPWCRHLKLSTQRSTKAYKCPIGWKFRQRYCPFRFGLVAEAAATPTHKIDLLRMPQTSILARSLVCQPTLRP
jgi:hypothetical protein